MDAAVVGALIKEGGGYLLAAVLLVILGATVRLFQVLLKREWERGDRMDAIIAKLVNQGENLLSGQERIERQLDGLRTRAR